MTLKVIGAGFGRTGTTSIKAALEQLGFAQCYHMQEVIKKPAHVQLWLDALEGKPVDWETLFTGYQATVDWPACNFYAQLMAHYPDAKVLLTVRDPDKWYDSCLNTIYAMYHKPVMRLVRRLVPPMHRFMAMNDRLIWQGDFGGRFSDRDHAIAVFNQHNAAVKAYVPSDRLLVYDVKEGWEPLCRFLDVPVPQGIPFPHLNDTGTFQRMFQLAYGVIGLLGIGGVALLWVLIRWFL
jgi:Sulfotransferase domain